MASKQRGAGYVAAANLDTDAESTVLSQAVRSSCCT